MSNEKTLDEIRRLCDPYSILVIYGRRLYKVRCPFKVRVLIDVGGLKGGEDVWVEKVLVTPELRMIFLVRGVGFYFHIFQILPFNI